MLTYFLQVNLCWLLFYGLYYVLLSKETFFTLNRIYLIISLLCGLVIPLSISRMETLPPTPIVEMVQPIVVSMAAFQDNIETNIIEAQQETWSIWTILMGLYGIGMAFFLLKFGIGLYKVFQLYRCGKKQPQHRFTLVNTEGVKTPFSFFRWIFINDTIVENADFQHIIIHEKAHVAQKHSFDIVGLEILRGLFWGSPLVHLYARSLRNVHEYLADAAVLQNTEKKQYGRLLIHQTAAGSGLVLANHFNFSQLKKRIIMMSRNPSQRVMLMKYTLAVPVFLLLVSFLASPNNTVMETSSTIGNALTTTAATTEISMNSIAEIPILSQLLPTSDVKNGDMPIVCLAVSSPEPVTNGYVKLGIFQNINGLMLKNNAQKLYSISQFMVYKKSKEGNLSKAILNTTGGAYNEEVEKLVSTAQIGDRYYFHDILVTKKGSDNLINLGTMQFFVGELAQQPPFDVVKYPIPNPTVSMANMGTISRNAFIKQKNLDINQPQYNSPVTCAVQSFVVVHKPFGKSANEYQQVNNTSSKYAPSTLELIQKAQNGDVYEFRNIKVRCPGDAVARNLESFTIKISDDNSVAKSNSGNEEPEFIGGKGAMLKFLSKNIQYPKTAREQGIKGTANVVFVVEKDGSLTTGKNKESLVADVGYFKQDTLYITAYKAKKEPELEEQLTINDPIFVEEGNRVVQLMPKWKPATKDGTPVKSIYGFVIKFKFE